jgi:glucose-6-phosphate isomerase
MPVFIDWYIQLLSESIGKSPKVGITPIKAIGVKDQHSQLQLFLDGPKDKFFIFLKHDGQYGDLKIPGERYKLSDLFNAEYEGVKAAFRKKKIPYFEIRFPVHSPEIIGELLFFFELQVAFLGLLFGINFENQPAVELSKSYTKKELGPAHI